MSTCGDVESTSGSLPNSAPGSPKSKVKFLCSHGGKILPRPADGHLKYVGGETRVISVPRNITFVDLMKKLTSLIEGDMILKYQLIPEDLDALVTVKSDEDLRHMFEEYDRHELLGAPRLRAFLFPANPIVMENQMGPMDRNSLEQRYINSVNGIVVHPTPMFFRPPSVNTNHTSLSISSACSSPRTPPDTATAADCINPEIAPLRGKLGRMPRARSSPNLYNLGGTSQCNHKLPSPTFSLNQQYPFHHRQPPHHIQPHSHLYLHPSPKPPLDPHPHKNCGPEHLLRVRSTGLPDYTRHQTEHAPNHYTRPNRGGLLVYQRGLPYDDYYGNSSRYDRTESPPWSPLARSPLQSNYMTKWDSVVPGRT